MNINVSIERLVLDGLPMSSAQGSLLAAAVETELARLLATGGLDMSLKSGGARPSVPVTAVPLTATKPTQLGQQIAKAVYQGIGREESATSRARKGNTYVK